MTSRDEWNAFSPLVNSWSRLHDFNGTQHYSWFPPSRNVGNVSNVRNLVNVGRWRNGHTLRTLRENMETHQWFLLVNSYGFYVKNRNRFCSYRFHVYVTFLPYTWKRIREDFHVYVIFYVTYVNYLRDVKVEITSQSRRRVHGRSHGQLVLRASSVSGRGVRVGLGRAVYNQA